MTPVWVGGLSTHCDAHAVRSASNLAAPIVAYDRSLRLSRVVWLALQSHETHVMVWN